MHLPIVRLVAGRILLSLLTLLIVSLIIFAVLEILPGDVATRILGRDATPEALELLRAKLGLNDPAPMRYFHWLGGLLTGDLGQSLASSRPVGEIVAPRIYNTVLLSAYAFLLYAAGPRLLRRAVHRIPRQLMWRAQRVRMSSYQRHIAPMPPGEHR